MRGMSRWRSGRKVPRRRWARLRGERGKEMKMRPRTMLCAVLIGLAPADGVGNFCGIAQGREPREKAGSKPAVVRDLMWVWGNPEMAREGEHTVASFAQASPAQRARLLGVPNIVMAGLGVPRDDDEADAIAKPVGQFKRLVWEIAPDHESAGPPFDYQARLAQVRRLVDNYPQSEGVLLDDLSTLGIDRGLKPEHIRRVRELLGGKYRSVKVWGVVYTMSLGRQGIAEYVKELDGIHLWTWHAKDVVDLERNVERCERLFPRKPIVLGLYLYDYGGGRRMPLDLLEAQCHTALRLAHAGRIQGIVFLTITNDAEAVGWTSDWIKQVGDQRLGSRSERSGAGRE